MAILVLLNTPSGVLRPITDWPLVAGDAEGPYATPAHAPSRDLADCARFTDVYAAGFVKLEYEVPGAVHGRRRRSARVNPSTTVSTSAMPSLWPVDGRYARQIAPLRSTECGMWSRIPGSAAGSPHRNAVGCRRSNG